MTKTTMMKKILSQNQLPKNLLQVHSRLAELKNKLLLCKTTILTKMNYQRQHLKDNYQSQAAEVQKDLLLHQKRKLKIYLE